ncbi:C-type lectin domain family 2 member F-like [Castor canadensis]|uniref:C-type lectin domain family 2 member F-like n=1 Tax=Castor canadensis TaxID=51338 RepID=A0A8B7U257_CASCN|nr:C-type lectin domain family 2 member F-like [Castor canadensis]
MQEEENKDRTKTEAPKTKSFEAKKMIIISSLVCGSLAFLLWGILRFPRKFGITKIFKKKACLDDERTCPQGWIQVNKNCFFHSEHETTWLNGNETCKVYFTSLAYINNEIEMDTLMESMSYPSYWIGLNKLNPQKIWKWANGNLFNNWYAVEEGGDCAFLHEKGINSTNCDEIKGYICSTKSYCP